MKLVDELLQCDKGLSNSCQDISFKPTNVCLKVAGSISFILIKNTVQNLMAIHPMVVNVFQY